MRMMLITLSWCAGIVIANTFSVISTQLWLISIIVTMVFAGWIWSTRWRGVYLVWSCVLLGAFSLSIIPKTSPIAAYNGQTTSVSGMVSTAPDRRDDRTQLRLESGWIYDSVQDEWLPTSGQVLVNADRLIDVTYGDYVTVTGQLITPGEFDTFSYRDYLARGGIHTVIERADVIPMVDTPNGGNPLVSWLYETRQSAHRVVMMGLPDPQAALLSGILLGEERGIEPALGDAFSAVGAAHIIAISGFNMVIVAAVITRIMSRLTDRKGIILSTGTAVIVTYTLFVGANGAVVRAAVMTVIMMFGQYLDRPTYLPASLAFSVWVLLLFNPLWLWDISFQLSVAAVLGIFVFVPPLTTLFDRLWRQLLSESQARTVGDWLQEPLVVSIAAMLTTSPLIVLYFQRLSVVALLVNVLIVPVQSVILILGGLATLIGLIVPAIAQVLFYGVLVLLSWTIGVVRLFGSLSWADVPLTVDSRLVFLFFVILLGGSMVQVTRPDWSERLLSRLIKRPVVYALAGSSVLIFVLLAALLFSRPDGRFHIWWLDMGDSNAVLMQTPAGAQILVDGGRYPSRLLTALGDRMPFNDRVIDTLFITHPDEFDTGALPALLDRYQVGAVITNGQPNATENHQAILERLARQSVPIANVTRGYHLTTGDGVLIEVLSPATQPEIADAFDETAMVLRVTYGEAVFLITSDAGEAVLSDLLTDDMLGHAQVVQLPQHGAPRTLSTAVWERLQAQVAVLQVDISNRRGLPDADILHLLGDMPLMRTDEMGHIHMWTDGKNLSVQGTK